jgi:hypothetical protein
LFEPEPTLVTLLNLDLPVGLFDFLVVFPSPFKKASMAFFRTVVMTFFDLKSAGVPPVMKIRPPSLTGSSLAGTEGLFDGLRGSGTEVDHVSVPIL